jgi:hypothetical protein
MFSANVKSDVLAMLRQDYQRKVQLLTEGLCRQFADAGGAGREGGELAVRASVLHQVEALCHRIFVRDAADAFLVLACSPSAAIADDGGGMGEAEWVASRAVALDVLREARRHGWIRTVRAGSQSPSPDAVVGSDPGGQPEASTRIDAGF